MEPEFSEVDKSNPNCAVIGDAADTFTYQNLNNTFRAIIAMESPVLFSMGRGYASVCLSVYSSVSDKADKFTYPSVSDAADAFSYQNLNNTFRAIIAMDTPVLFSMGRGYVAWQTHFHVRILRMYCINLGKK